MVVRYEQFGKIGDGPLLVFIHGGGAGGWMWDKQVSYFTDYHCIVPTLQGHGVRSEEGTFSIRDNAKQLIDLIENKRASRPVHVIGFSIGAQIILEMLSLAPHLIRTAVVNSALIRPMAWVFPLIGPTVRMTMPLVHDRKFAKLQAKQLYMNKAPYFERYYEDSVKMKAATLVDMLRENLSFSLSDEISKSSTSILVTAGMKERKSVIESARELAVFHPNCQYLLIPGIGHGFPIARPDLFNQTVGQWLTEQSIEGLI
ncbi:alpha/beta hydrolase [Sporosarcina sp. 179-K 3D1 HS]|uniref:alpha/beta fold hydrolase n=1 Tax=Sporosarcina sp. 179-K 3D1 HS TaxID=3232169 RepID=UPI0039A0B779